MLKYKLIEESENYVKYLYFPDGREEYGSVTVNKRTGDVLEMVIAKVDQFKRYCFHLIDEIEDFIESGNFKNEGIVAWY